LPAIQIMSFFELIALQYKGTIKLYLLVVLPRDITSLKSNERLVTNYKKKSGRVKDVIFTE